MSQTLFISHRGESADAPENTLQAFRLAMARDTDGIECDIRLTRDRQVLVCHDPHTGRMGDRLAMIQDTDSETLRQINVRGAFSENAFVQIPTLEEVLEELPEGKLIFIEIKPEQDPFILTETRRILDASGIADDQIVLISFDRKLLSECRQELPGYKTLWLTEAQDEQGRLWTPQGLQKVLQELQADGVDIAADELLLTGDFIREFKKMGYMVAVWTVDGTGQARRLAEAGADVITSNRAAAILQQLS